MSFFERLKTEASAEWSVYTEHPFIAGLADGTLPQTAFRHYLVQDYLFLIEFARAYALAVYKSPQLTDMREAAWPVGDPRRRDEPPREALCRLGSVAPRPRASSAGFRDAGIYTLCARCGNAWRSADTQGGAIALRGRLRRDRGSACSAA
jgi:hypothetical protein